MLGKLAAIDKSPLAPQSITPIFRTVSYNLALFGAS